MRRWLSVLLLLLACTSNTITLPDGTMMTCMTCCFGNVCNTTCY